MYYSGRHTSLLVTTSPHGALDFGVISRSLSMVQWLKYASSGLERSIIGGCTIYCILYRIVYSDVNITAGLTSLLLGMY